MPTWNLYPKKVCHFLRTNYAGQNVFDTELFLRRNFPYQDWNEKALTPPPIYLRFRNELTENFPCQRRKQRNFQGRDQFTSPKIFR